VGWTLGWDDGWDGATVGPLLGWTGAQSGLRACPVLVQTGVLQTLHVNLRIVGPIAPIANPSEAELGFGECRDGFFG